MNEEFCEDRQYCVYECQHLIGLDKSLFCTESIGKNT